MENLSLFDEDLQVPSALPVEQPRLEVVDLAFREARSVTWQELFEGYDTLRAITYSSGIGFLYSLLERFQEAEVLFGCEAVLSYSLQEVMAYQCRLLRRLRETASERKLDLLNRLEEGSVRFYVANTALSHEKLYLLSAADGRRRVIMGSANLSWQAFTGAQRETICCLDDEQAYEWYLERYTSLREACTDAITKSAYLFADDGEHLQELPIAGSVRTRRAVLLEPREDPQQVRFALDVRNLAKKFAPSVPKPDRKTGKLLLSPDNVRSIQRQVLADEQKARELRSEYPQLIVDVDLGRVTLNGQELDLSPAPEDIRRDAELFLRYMAGYEKFHGDVTGLQYRYFAFANWFFCTPFMAVMRDMAIRYNQNLLPYPVFGLVYGQSKAGKTSFLETLLKMMIGQKTKISAPDFTRSSIERLKGTVEGAPIIVDDLTNARFNQHAIETIKNDDFGVAEHMLHYPAVVISANEDVKAVAPEVIRRTVICRVQAGLTNTEVMRSNVVRPVQREMGTAFYREYLRRMLDIVPGLLEQMKSDEAESAPDILSASSRVLVELFRGFGPRDLPDYVRELDLEDYFSERVTGSYAIKTIQNAWRTSRGSFRVTRRTNELRYNAGATWEADRILKELPETLEAHKSRDWVVMNLDAAREFFGLDFRASWLPWKKD